MAKCVPVVRALHSPMSHNFLRYYPLSPHPPHLELKRNEIYSLPRATFRGRKIIVAPGDEVKYRNHILKLANNQVLGFDVELHNLALPCLVQLASERVCIMWQLSRKAVRTKKIPPLLHSILTSPEVLKVGCNSRHDISLLLKHCGVNTRNVFDTLGLAAALRLRMAGLQGTVAVFLGYHLSKSLDVRASNWSRTVLSPKQVAYASADAWASLLVYQEMMQYAAKTGIVPLPPIKQANELQRHVHVVETRGEKNMVVCVIKRQAQHSLRSESSPAPCGDTPESSPTPCGDTAESSPSPCGDTPESSSSPCGDTPESSPAPCGNTPESSPTPCTDTPESNPPLYNSAPPPVRMYQRQSSQKGDEIGTLHR